MTEPRNEAEAAQLAAQYADEEARSADADEAERNWDIFEDSTDHLDDGPDGNLDFNYPYAGDE